MTFVPKTRSWLLLALLLPCAAHSYESEANTASERECQAHLNIPQTLG